MFSDKSMLLLDVNITHLRHVAPSCWKVETHSPHITQNTDCQLGSQQKTLE